MTSIDTTVRTAVGEDISRSYNDHVTRVVNALQQREDRIKQGLAGYARRRGLSQGEIDRLLRDVGMEDNLLQHAAQTTETSSALRRLAQQLSEQVADLNRRIQNL